MRTYRKRTPQLRHCVHCHEAFESKHKRAIYCGNSCSTLAYYARKKQAASSLAAPANVAESHPTTPAPAAETPAVTLALNAQNLALFTAGPLLADGVKQAVEWVGNLLAPAPPVGPCTWLPGIFQLIREPLVPFQRPDWEEPRFFVPVPWAGEQFYYRAAQDLLFWQAPDGLCYQLTQHVEFTQLLARRRLWQAEQRQVAAAAQASLPPLAQPK